MKCFIKLMKYFLEVIYPFMHNNAMLTVYDNVNLPLMCVSDIAL